MRISPTTVGLCSYKFSNILRKIEGSACLRASYRASVRACEPLESGWVLVPPLEVLGGAALEVLLRKVHG
jgi:hypothetical protein